MYLIIVIIIATSIGLYFSYKKAHKVADEMVQPIMDELYYYSTSFNPIIFNDQIHGPIWIINYEPKKQMLIAPLNIQVSILGKVIMTSPKNLKVWIKNRSTEKVQKKPD